MGGDLLKCGIGTDTARHNCTACGSQWNVLVDHIWTDDIQHEHRQRTTCCFTHEGLILNIPMSVHHPGADWAHCGVIDVGCWLKCQHARILDKVKLLKMIPVSWFLNLEELLMLEIIIKCCLMSLDSITQLSVRWHTDSFSSIITIPSSQSTKNTPRAGV